MGCLQLHTENLKISATNPLAFTTWVVKDLLFLEHSAGPHKTYREKGLASVHSSICLRAAGDLPRSVLRLRDALMLQPVSVHENCYMTNVFISLSLQGMSYIISHEQLKALFFTGLSINTAPKIYIQKIYIPKIAKSRIVSTSCGSSHQPMTISSTIIFIRNLKIIF